MDVSRETARMLSAPCRRRKRPEHTSSLFHVKPDHRWAEFMDAERTAEKLSRYADFLAASPHNLTSRNARAELSTRHIPESVAFAARIPQGTNRLVDIGSGGGLPGFVIAVQRPEIDVHLVESSLKKASFLREVAEELRVTVTVHRERAEVLATGPLAGTFDVATARAVAALPKLVVLAMPLLRPGGVLLAVKGARWRSEVAEAAPAFSKWDVELVDHPDDTAADPAPGEAPRIVTLRRGPAATG